MSEKALLLLSNNFIGWKMFPTCKTKRKIKFFKEQAINLGI